MKNILTVFQLYHLCRHYDTMIIQQHTHIFAQSLRHKEGHPTLHTHQNHAPEKTKRLANHENETVFTPNTILFCTLCSRFVSSYGIIIRKNKTTIIFCMMTPRFAYNTALLLGDMNGHSNMLLRATARVRQKHASTWETY